MLPQLSVLNTLLEIEAATCSTGVASILLLVLLKRMIPSHTWLGIPLQAALAYLLNATLAVTTSTQHRTRAEASSSIVPCMHPQAFQVNAMGNEPLPASGLAAVIDTQRFETALKPFLKLSWGLPPHLWDTLTPTHPSLKTPPLDPASPQSYLPHVHWLHEHGVLRAPCSPSGMVWSTQVRLMPLAWDP